MLLAGCSGAEAPRRDPVRDEKGAAVARSTAETEKGAILSPLQLPVARAMLAPGADCVLQRGADALAIVVAGDGLVLVNGERRRLTGVPSDADALFRGGSFTAGDVALSIRLAPDIGEGELAGGTATKPVRVAARQGARVEQFEAALVCSTDWRPSEPAAAITPAVGQPKLAVEGESLR